MTTTLDKKTMSRTALQKTQPSDLLIGIFPLEFDDGSGEQESGGSSAIPTSIHLIPIGQWQHDLYGPITITASDIREFVQNYNANVRKGVFITAGHEGFQELPAQGWITRVEARDDGLWGDVEWNELGKETLSDKQYKYFSPEFYRDYEDPQTHDIYRNVLTGGALTKSPYFKELEAVVFSDKKLKKNFNDNTMDLQELLKKDVADLKPEEISFIKEHKSELTDEQKVSHTSILDVETAEEKTAREEKETGDSNEAKGLNRDGSAKTETTDTGAQQHSEKVMINASELALLKQKADQGQQAFKELQDKKTGEQVSALLFSNTNKDGKFLPKSKDTLRAFMETLNDAQRTSFSALVAQLPSNTQLFTESGVDASKTNEAAGTNFAVIEGRIAELQKADPKMSYSDALRKVMADSEEKGEGLEQRFDSELVPTRKIEA